jgi:hypothetical protein
MAEELSGQADRLRESVAFFTLKSGGEQRRIVDRNGSDRDGHAAGGRAGRAAEPPKSRTEKPKEAGSRQSSGEQARNETGIALADEMSASEKGKGDRDDEDFEEF